MNQVDQYSEEHEHNSITEDEVTELIDSFEGKTETRSLCNNCINYINCIEVYKNKDGNLICEDCNSKLSK